MKPKADWQHVERHLIDTADEFMDKLAPRGGMFASSYLQGCSFFRGHADARWSLLPTVFREDVGLLHPGEWTTGLHDNNLEQIKAEAGLLWNFFRLADRNGLALPGDSQQLRKLLKEFSGLPTLPGLSKKSRLVKACWPPDDLLPLVAVAQHHRVPTRLLDWTSSSYVAAYFAAATAATWLYRPHSHERKGATQICVWVITGSLFDAAQFLPPEERSKQRIVVVETPSAGNPNLRSQKGVFLMDRPEVLDLDGPVDTRPWDELLRESFSFVEGSPVIYQLSLPIEQAPRLLRLLTFEGIDGSAVFPGFDGVFAALNERKYWESAEEYHAREKVVAS